MKRYRPHFQSITASTRLVDYLRSSAFNIEDFVNKVDEEDAMMDLIGESFRSEVVNQAMKSLISEGFSIRDVYSPEVKYTLRNLVSGYGEIY